MKNSYANFRARLTLNFEASQHLKNKELGAFSLTMYNIALIYEQGLRDNIDKEMAAYKVRWYIKSECKNIFGMNATAIRRVWETVAVLLDMRNTEEELAAL